MKDYFFTEKNDRCNRDLAIALCENGDADVQQMLIACLKYMTTDEVKDMLIHNEIVTDGFMKLWEKGR
tara:strand:+ start:982 stop:1185 length:204 start_codon:yes stop_codon:yes gene_type:complete